MLTGLRCRCDLVVEGHQRVHRQQGPVALPEQAVQPQEKTPVQDTTGRFGPAVSIRRLQQRPLLRGLQDQNDALEGETRCEERGDRLVSRNEP